MDMKDNAVLLVDDFTTLCVFTLCVDFGCFGGCEHSSMLSYVFKLEV